MPTPKEAKKLSGQLGGAEELTRKFYASKEIENRAVMTHVSEDAFLIACDAENVFRFFYSTVIDIRFCSVKIRRVKSVLPACDEVTQQVCSSRKQLFFRCFIDFYISRKDMSLGG